MFVQKFQALMGSLFGDSIRTMYQGFFFWTPISWIFIAHHDVYLNAAFEAEEMVSSSCCLVCCNRLGLAWGVGVLAMTAQPTRLLLVHTGT